VKIFAYLAMTIVCWAIVGIVALNPANTRMAFVSLGANLFIAGFFYLVCACIVTWALVGEVRRQIHDSKIPGEETGQQIKPSPGRDI
jgi:hypothetical protein